MTTQLPTTVAGGAFSFYAAAGLRGRVDPSRTGLIHPTAAAISFCDDSVVVTDLPRVEFGVAFVVLKLCDVIDWSWWWVLSPLWITAFAVIGILVILFVVFCCTRK